MALYRLSLVLIIVIWGATLYMWQIPDDLRWDMGIHDYYAATFFELPLFTFALATFLMFKRKYCTSKALRVTTLCLCWFYTVFPLLTSVLLILITVLGITGY